MSFYLPVRDPFCQLCLRTAYMLGIGPTSSFLPVIFVCCCITCNTATLIREMNIPFGFLSIGMFLHLQFQRPQYTELQFLVAVSADVSCQNPRSLQKCLTDACLHRVPPCWVLFGKYYLVPYVDCSEWLNIALAGSLRTCRVTMVTSDKRLLVLTYKPVRI
jgi:hypothetical protein